MRALISLLSVASAPARPFPIRTHTGHSLYTCACGAHLALVGIRGVMGRELGWLLGTCSLEKGRGGWGAVGEGGLTPASRHVRASFDAPIIRTACAAAMRLGRCVGLSV